MPIATVAVTALSWDEKCVAESDAARDGSYAADAMTYRLTLDYDFG